MSTFGAGSSSSPIVSIGVPVLNGQRYLATALDSLLSQDMPGLEVLISDNASTDDTPAIGRRYAKADSRVRYFRHATQSGAAANFNSVARWARGRYFKWAAHDDVCGSSFLSRCLEVLEQDPGIVLCYPQAVEIDEAGAVTRSFPPAVYAQEERPAQRVRTYLSFRTACLEAYGVMRHEVLLDTRMIGPYTSSDRVFLLEMALRGRFEQVASIEFYCRTHSERSLQRYGSGSDRRQWFDSADARPQWLPKWRLAGEFARAIIEAPVEPSERLRCLLPVAGWAVRNRQSLLRQLGAAGVQLGRRMGHSANFRHHDSALGGEKDA